MATTTMEGGVVEPAVRLLGPVDPKTGRRKPVVLPTNTVSGKVRRKLVGQGKMRGVGGGSTVVPIGGTGRVTAAATNTTIHRQESDSKKYGLSDPFGEQDDEQPGGAKRKIRSPRNGTEPPAGTFFSPVGKAPTAATTTTAPTACASILRTPTRSKSPSLPDIIDGHNRERADSASSSVTFSVAFDLDESRSWSPLKDGGTPSAPGRHSNSGRSKKSSKKSSKRSHRQSSAAEIKLAEFLKAETEAIRQLQQDDEDDDDDDAKSISSSTSQRSFASADSKKLYEETTQAVREAEDTARKMRETMEWLEKQNRRDQEEEEAVDERSEQEEAEEEKVEGNEVLEDQMIPLEELEREKASRSRSRNCSPFSQEEQRPVRDESTPNGQILEHDAVVHTRSLRGSVTSECVGTASATAADPTTAAPAAPSTPATPPSVDQTSASFTLESPSPRPLRHVSSSVAEYRRKRKVARKKKLARIAKVMATATLGGACCVFTVAKGGKMSLSVPSPQLGWTAPPPPSTTASRGEGIIDDTASSRLAVQSKVEHHDAMGGAYASIVPPHEAALANKANWRKGVPFLGMSIGDGY